MKNQFLIKTLIAFLGTLCLLFPKLQSQNLDLTGVASQVDFIKHFAYNTTTNDRMTVSLTNVGVGPITWEYCINSGCNVFTPVPTSRTDLGYGGLEIQQLTAPSRVRFSNSTNTLLEGEFSITLRAKQGVAGTFKSKTFKIIGREPLEMVFVLDISGSMECEPEDNVSAEWEACIAGSPNRRWDKLKNAVGQFMAKLNDNNHVLSTDQFSVAYFSGTNTNPASTFINLPATKFVDFTNFRPGISTDMTAREAGSAPMLMRDGTSIGTGLTEAINQRFGGAVNTAKRQVIVLLSDGEENRDPKVYVDASGKKIRNGPGGAVLVDFSAFADIEIFSIGFGASLVSLPPLLQSIASASDNVFYTLTGEEPRFLDEISGYAFNDIFNAYSPNLIRFEDQKLFTQNSAKFVCNENVPRLFFECTFEKPAGSDFSYQISRDGQDFTDAAQLSLGDYYATLTLKTERLADQKSGGVWTLTCSSATGSSAAFGSNIRLSATADDHDLELKCDAGQAAFKVGDKMTPTVQLSYKGSPVTKANVKAVIVQPGDDLGDLLARADIPDLPSAHTEEGSCGERRYAYLQKNNPAALNAVKQLKRDTISLIHSGNGVYSGQFDKLDVTGVYKIFYFANTSLIGGEEIVRTKVQTSYVRFGSVDYYQGGNKYGKVRFNSDNLGELDFRPTYTNNQGEPQYVGPGFSQFINVEGRIGNYLEVIDNCNGSYQLKFLAKPNDQIRITMLDEEIFKGSAIALNNPFASKRFGLSLHSGLTLPLEKLDSLYNNGFYIEADLSYRFLPNLSAELVGGHYRFKDNFYINGVCLYAKGHYAINTRLEGNAGIGLGLFQPKQKNLDSGFSARVGLMYRLSTHWNALFDAGYFNLPTPKYSYSTLGLGVKYLF